MNTFPDALARLRYHCGLDYDEEREKVDPSLVAQLYRWTRACETVDIEPQLMDLIGCLEVINHHLNGAVPSHATQTKTSDVPRALAAAVSSLCLRLSDDILSVGDGQPRSEMRRRLQVYLWRALFAWNAVLDGDIDDVRECVAANQQAHGFH